MDKFIEELIPAFEGTLPLFLIAFAILAAGWFLAWVIKTMTLRLLERTKLDDLLAAKLGNDDPTQLNLSISKTLSILVRLAVLVVLLRFIYTIEPIKLIWDQLVELVDYLSTLGIVIFLIDLLLLAVTTLILVRIIRWINQLFEMMVKEVDSWRKSRIRSLTLQNLELLTADRLTDGLVVVTRYLRVVVLILIGLVYFSVIFSFFPQTRGIVSGILESLFSAISLGWLAFVNYLPSLFNLILIIVLTRYLLIFLHFLAREVGKGNITLAGFYPEWAEPTFQLVRILLIVFALVISFPFLPGSASPAFQGISIFIGALFSLGSTSVVANIVSGIVLTYTRAFKIGDRVRIADTEGDVLERSLLVTRIRTIKNVDITIPNGMVLSSHIVNYSSSAKEHGLVLNTTVTLGYDIPWQKVHETLIMAAKDTEDILESPTPFVLQISLDDNYVSYQLNAYTEKPAKMAQTYSDLHQNIQDQSHKAGFEILSPHYRSIRDGGRSTIPEEYLPEDYSSPGFTINKREEN